MKLSELGEFGLIERIKARSRSAGADIVVGIGDDCAVIRRGETLEVLTTDCLVEGSHFQKGWLSMKDIGWKAIAVNVSDVAAMGGVPSYALITLFLPDDLTTGEIDDLYEGMEECAKQYGVGIVGGDIVRIQGPFAISVVLSGICERDEITLRSGARVGDLVVVTGTLGEAAIGMEILKKGKQKLGEALMQSLARFRRPEPRLKASRAILEMQPSSMIDVSDGLLSDLWHLLEASGVGARLDAEKIPVGEGVLEYCSGNRQEALSVALSGGEDYELLFTLRPHLADKIAEIEKKAEIRLTVIGEITQKEKGVKLATSSGETALQCEGFDHFRTKRNP